MSHAKLAPSAAARWMQCPGSIPLSKDAPDSSSEYAAEGTVAHDLAAMAWAAGLEAREFIGTVMEADGFQFEVDIDMAEAVQVFLDQVAREPGEHHCEIRLPLDKVLHAPDQWGTADRVVLQPDQQCLQVHDLKFGRGVQVYARDNEQLLLYAAGAAVQFPGPWERVKVAIHQPRIGHYDEHTVSRDELIEFIKRARSAVKMVEAAEACTDPVAFENTYLAPSDKACQWCPAAGRCPAYTKAVHEETSADFEDISDNTTVALDMDDARLAEALRRVDWVKGWVEAVQAEAHSRAMAGRTLPGWKLVTGRAGARRWADAEAAEKALKAARFKVAEMYDMKLISPTAAEKLVGRRKPKTWRALQELITRSEGKLHLAPEADSRPAESPHGASVDDFEDLTGGA